MNKAQITNLLGQDIDINRMAKILCSLYIKTTVAGDTLNCIIPTYRADIEGAADIAEEIQRIHGYDHIPSNQFMTPNAGSRNLFQNVRMQVEDVAVGWGFFEAYTFAFVSPSVLDKLRIPLGSSLRDGIVLQNPLGEDYSFMRTTLAPGLLQSISSNLNHKANDIRLFEIGNTFHPNSLPVVELPVETPRICLGVMEDGFDFYALKGMVEGIMQKLHIKDVDYITDGPSWLHPGRKAVVVIDGKQAGYIGEVHPDVSAGFGIKKRVYMAELDLALMTEYYRAEVEIKPVAKFPSSMRDLAVVVDDSQNVGPMLRTIKAGGGKILESVSVFDIYRSDALGADKKSVAFSMSFRRADRTLEDGEVNKQFDRILAKLANDFGAEIRS